MPRKAPNLNGGVIEHRITLGDYERKMISKQLSEDDLIKKIQTGQKIGQSIMIGAGGLFLGTIAVTAYREANDLVDTIKDAPAGIWAMTKYRLGLITFEELMNTVEPMAEENAQASTDRKNKGILEWGFEWMLKFLLGEDMIFTKATESTTDPTPNPDPNPNPYLPENDEFDPNKYDPTDPFYSTSSEWYWHGALNHWMPITIYDDTYNPRPVSNPPKLKPNDGLEYWENLESIFCDITSPDFDRELCTQVQLDKAQAGF